MFHPRSGVQPRNLVLCLMPGTGTPVAVSARVMDNLVNEAILSKPFPSPDTAELVSCVQCRAQIDRRTTEFNAAGSYICSSCSAQNDVAETDRRAVSAITGVSIASALMALCGLFLFNPFFLVSMVAVGQSLYVLRSMKDSYYRKRQRNYGLVRAIAIIGLIVGCLPPFLLVGFLIVALAV